eukprot:gnl/Trimastix_PCT/965.p1 GENE.gnl/Trimastix_PCT/965~~gnl/Trimastix_PCT/965.p1  ORF type:complete len:269 (-),score=23.57 gnl/Trimastix_PCT/965:38-844(-)
MSEGRTGCLICGKELVYLNTAEPMECSFCHRTFPSTASCPDRHFICDECHSQGTLPLIINTCKTSTTTDPIEIASLLMNHPQIAMHGPEHHALVPACIVASYRNAYGNVTDEQIEDAAQRGIKIPGGNCGFGCACAAPLTVGIAYSVLNKVTPLSGAAWGEGNFVTGKALQLCGMRGGPRCCKRNTYSSLQVARRVLRLGPHHTPGESAPQAPTAKMGPPSTFPDLEALIAPLQEGESEGIVCSHMRKNRQCMGLRCPFFPKPQRAQA